MFVAYRRAAIEKVESMMETNSGPILYPSHPWDWYIHMYHKHQPNLQGIQVETSGIL